MGRLTDTAAKQLAKTRSREELPDWFGRVGVVMGVILIVFIIWQLLGGTGGSVQQTTPNTLTPVTTQPTTPQPTADTTTPSTPPVTGPGQLTGIAPIVNNGATVSLPSTAGTSIPVSSQAADIAKKAAVAGLTGDWDQVALQPGITPPPPASFWPTPSVGGVTVVSQNISGTNGTIVFNVAVDPDGGGVEPVRNIGTTIALTNGAWSYQP